MPYQEELSDLLGKTADTEKRIMEIAALQQAFAEHVLVQAHQIEGLYNEVRRKEEEEGKGRKG